MLCSPSAICSHTHGSRQNVLPPGGAFCVSHSSSARKEPVQDIRDVYTVPSVCLAYPTPPLAESSYSIPLTAPAVSPDKICPLTVQYCCRVSLLLFFFKSAITFFCSFVIVILLLSYVRMRERIERRIRPTKKGPAANAPGPPSISGKYNDNTDGGAMSVYF